MSGLKIDCCRDGISRGCNTFGVSGHFLFIFRFDLFALIGVAVCDISLIMFHICSVLTASDSLACNKSVII